MKKVERVVEYIYVAPDGRQFDNEYDCMAYEAYYKKDFLELIEDYVILEEKAKEEIRARRTPIHTYALCVKEMPESLKRYVRIYANTYPVIRNPIPICDCLFTPSLFYYSYSEYGSDGWKNLFDVEHLEKQVKFYENGIEMFKKLAAIQTEVES